MVEVTDALARGWLWVAQEWTTFEGAMAVRDWIDLALAAFTFLLALATFQLARYARQTARDSAAALDAFRKQAAASDRHADIAARAVDIASKGLVEQREQAARQTRVHMAWLQSGDSDFEATTDPGFPGPAEGEEGAPAIELRARVRNLSPIAAYIERIEGPASMTTSIIDDAYVPPGGEGRVTLYVRAKPREQVSIILEPVRVYFYSMASGEAGMAEGKLDGYFSLEPPGDSVVTWKKYVVHGWINVSAAGKRPTVV